MLQTINWKLPVSRNCVPKGASHPSRCLPAFTTDTYLWKSWRGLQQGFWNQKQKAETISIALIIVLLSSEPRWWRTSSWRRTAPPSQCCPPRRGWPAPPTRARREPGSCRCGTWPSRRISSTRSERGCNCTGAGQGVLSTTRSMTASETKRLLYIFSWV